VARSYVARFRHCWWPWALAQRSRGLVSAVPQIVWLSEHKEMVFAVAAIALAIAGAMQWRSRRAPCPADPRIAAACMQARRFSRVYALSVGLVGIGAFFAFVATALV